MRDRIAQPTTENIKLERIQVNARAKVNNDLIRNEVHNGREHIVIPSFTLPSEIVMNGGLYPRAEIDKSYKQLEDTLAPIGHPTINGVHVSAKRPEAINAHYVGAFNKAVQRSGERIYMEKWVDVEIAKKHEKGLELLEAIERGDPIHTSTGIFMQREMVANAKAGDKHTWIARNMIMDHDAILLGEPGAATPEDGVGLMVNSEGAELVVNADVPELVVNGVLVNSYGKRRDIIAAALRERFAGGDKFAYVEDWDASQVVFSSNDGMQVINYVTDGDNVIFEGEPTPVVIRSEFYEKDGGKATSLALVKNAVECDPIKIEPTIPELKAMDEAQVKELIANALNPVQAKLEAVEKENGELKAQLQVNADAVDAENRAVILAAKPALALTVNALSGKPLAEMAAEYQTAAPLASGFQVNRDQKAAHDLSAYEGV